MEPDVDALAAPPGDLAAGLVEHPTTDRDDEPALLREGHELEWPDLATQTRVPAQQGFYGDDPTSAHVDDGLVGDRKLLAVDRPTQLAFELDLAQDVGVHLGLEQLDTALAQALGAVHREVGVAYETVGIVVRSGDGHPDARTHRGLGTAEVERRLEHLEQPASHLARTADKLRCTVAAVRRTRRRRGGRRSPRRTAATSRGSGAEQRSPCSWPSVSLTSLKPSRSMNSNETGVSSPTRAARASPTRSRIRDPVGKPGELIAESQLGEPVLKGLALTDVARIDDNASYYWIVEPIGEDRLDVAPLAAGIAHPVLDAGGAMQVDAVSKLADRAEGSDEPQPRLEEVEWVDEVDEKLTDELALAIAEHPLDGGALPDDPAVGVDHGHHVARALDQ